jgi:hypothetical protein
MIKGVIDILAKWIFDFWTQEENIQYVTIHYGMNSNVLTYYVWYPKKIIC